jgi:hypothetical protein
MIKKTFLKRAFNRTKLRTLVSLGVLFILLPLVLLSLYKTSNTEAAWMNDSWKFRAPITFTHNAVVTNTKVKFDIATDTLITDGKIQSDCGDSRFTDANGQVLEYYIDTAVGACNTSSTDYYVLIPTIANGSNVIYHYYGNPTVINGTNSVQFDQATTSPNGGAGTVGTEARTTGPVVYYKMDQGTSGTCSATKDVCESMGTNYDGTLQNGAVWKNEDYCISGKCLYFDGSNDNFYVTSRSAIETTAQLSSGFTFEAWIRPNGAGEGTGGQIFTKTTNTWLRVDTLSGGKLDIEGSLDLATTDATLNVASAITNNQWTHVALSYTDDADDEITIWVNGKAVGTSTNGVGSPAGTQNDMEVAGSSSNNFQGFIDEFKVYNYERSTSQMALDATNGTSKGNSAIFGVTSNPLLSNGLVGNWEMDESAANTCTGGSNDNCDKSGNVNDGAWTNATVGIGLYSNGTTYDGTGDYVSVADSASLSMTQQVTVSAWVRPNSSIATKAIVVKDGSYRLVTDGSGNPICQVNNGSWQTAATSSTALSLSVWQHVVCIFDGTTQSIYINGALKGSSDATVSIADSANALRIGSDSGGTYGDYNGRIDSVRVYNKALQASEVTTLYNWQPSAVGWWKMDEGTGQNIYDSSGNGYNGTLGATTSVEAVDPTWVNGRFGNAVSFDGGTNNKYVLLGDNDGLDVTTNEGLTISGWVRRTGNAQFNNRQYIYDKINSGSNAGYSLTIETTSACNDAASDGNLVCFSMSDGTDTYFIRTTSTTITADSTWHYVTATIDRDSETNSLLYIDGVAQAVTRSGTFANVGDLSSTTVSCIGLNSAGATNCMTASPTNQMNGDIDGVKIYKYPRTQAQIVEDMNSSHPAGGSPIGSQVIKWAFDEGQGTTANNQVSGGTAGTLTNIASPATSTSGWTQTGKTNKAIVFDGSNDAVVIATASDASVDFNGSEPFSICSYVYPTTMAGSSEADLIVGKWDATTPTRGYRLYLTNDDADTTGNFRTEIYDESADQTISAAGAIDTVSVNTWYHVCMTFNGGSAGAADDLKLYVNSVNTASNTVNASFLGLEDVTADMTVGDYDTTDAVAGDTAFTGTIDEVQVYAGVLTGDQVKVIMNANAGINFGSTTTDETTQITGSAETGPILYMPFSEGTGTSALDRSGNDRTGTLRNRATWVNGKVGSGVYFDGVAAGTLATDTHVSFSADILDSLTTEATFETWFKPNDTGDDFQDFMAYKEEGGTKTGKYIEMAYERSTDKVWVYTDWATNCATNIQASVAMSGTQTAWHHFAFTMSTTGNALYIDGVKQTLTYGAGSSSTSCNLSNWSTGGGGSTYFTLGCWLNTATACYDPEMYEGALDEVKVFNYARTPAQIAYDVNRGAPIGWWKFDDCTGATAYDSSGNGNNATLTYGGGTYTAAGTCTSGTSSDGWYGGAVGRFNGGIAVDTTTDTISVGNITLYTFERTTPFTTSIWMKTSSLSAMTLMSKQDSSAPFSGWNVQTSGSGYIYLQLVNTYSSNTLEMRTTNSTNYSDGTWHHVVTTYDGTSTPAGVHIYFDGRDIALTTSVNSLSSSITNSILMYVGSRNGTAQKFDGLLDDARLYNYALTASQVKKLYNENAAARFGPATGTP